MEYYKAMSSIIENATDVSKSEPVVSEFREVAELIKTRSDMPKEAVRNFMARIQKKTKSIVMLTLELIEYCTCTCEMNFHTALNNKEFLLKISALLSSQNTEPEVKDKVLQVLAVFNRTFKRDIHPTYFQFQDRVKQKGFYIPEDYMSRYKGQTAGVGSASNYQSYKPKTGSGFDGGFSQPSKPASFQSKSKDPGQVAPKYQSAKNDLQKLKEKIQQANKMIDDHDTSIPVSQNQQLCHFMDVLSKKDTLLQNLIGQCIDDEAMAQFALPLNDDLNSTIERFDLLKSGVKVDNTKGQDVEPEILRQIEEMELRDKQEKQKSAQKPAGFSAFDDFPASQPPKPVQQQQQAPPPPAQNSNLLDLMDDAPPSQPPQQQQNQPPQQQQQNNQGGDLFDMMDAPPQQNQAPQVQQNQFQPPQQQNQFQPPQQQFQAPPQQDKYAALNMPLQQQQFNPMAQGNNNPFGAPGGMGGGFNQPPQNNFNQPPQNNFNQPPQNNGFMPPTQNNGFMPPTQNNFNQPPQQNNSFMPPTQNNFVPPPPANNQQFLPQGYKGPGAQNNQNQDKGAFGDLDDMFGLGGGKPQPPQNQPQQQQFNQPPQQQQQNNNQGGGFDLF